MQGETCEGFKKQFACNKRNMVNGLRRKLDKVKGETYEGFKKQFACNCIKSRIDLCCSVGYEIRKRS